MTPLQSTWLVSAALIAALGVGCKPKSTSGGSAGGVMAMRVVALEVRRGPVVESVSLVGELAANEAVEVKSETDGVVQEVLFQEGQEIPAGHLLLRLDDTKLAAELADSEARLRLSQSTYDRAQQLLADRLISRQEYDQAVSTFEASRASIDLRKRQLKDARIYAPFKGRTGARQVSPGQVITRNTTITWLVDLDPMKVEVNVPERFLSQTQVGQRIAFSVTAYPGRTFEGEIFFISPQLDRETRTALLKTRIPNPDGLLKAGMVARLELRLKSTEDALLVPEVALISNGNQYFVFVVDHEQKAELRPVTVGQRVPRWAQITTGLQGGERIVVEGHQKIGPGMPVQLAPAEKAAVYQTLELRPAPVRGETSSNAAPVATRE
jgi:membrane fusion protein, multidrug efflux system